MIWHDSIAFFLLSLPFFILTYFYFFKKVKGAFLYSGLALISNQSFFSRSSFVFLPKLLRISALIFIIIALARPQRIEQMTNQTQEGLDIMIVMDISLSMLIQDMGQMTRLGASQRVVQKFIDNRPNDRMGLIVFSGESFTKTPLTFDHEVLKSNLKQITTLPSLKDGTAIGVALANATVRLKHSPPESRIIIFLTDGENNAGFIDPETALQLTKKNRIKVYTIGLGSKVKGTFPIKYKVQNSRGQNYYRKMYVKSQINRKLMQKISSQTGGRFFMAKDIFSLENIFKVIDKLETYEIQVNKWTQYQELFNKFLFPGFLLYLLYILFSLTVFFRGI